MMTVDEFAKKLSRTADRISSRILHEDIEWIDVQIEIENMRALVLAECPEKAEVFERIYEARFRRLWDQWHGDVYRPDW